LNAIRDIIKALDETKETQIVISKANADYGGKLINEYLNQISIQNSKKYRLYASLGQTRYFSYMKQVQYVIGNSSSGITESPFLHIPAINVGKRQKGRYLCKNVIQSSVDLPDIQSAIKKAEQDEFSKEDCLYWGDGNTASKVIREIKQCLFA
jgi:UDP-N-acetylglucosamine 2-epimerase